MEKPEIPFHNPQYHEQNSQLWASRDIFILKIKLCLPPQCYINTTPFTQPPSITSLRHYADVKIYLVTRK